MKTHSYNNSRRLGSRQGGIIKGRGSAKQTPIRPLLEGQVRCTCGMGVKLRKDGTLMSHKTLVSKVPCIHSYTKPVL